MKILFATGNKNKIAEAGTLFRELGYDVEGLIVMVTSQILLNLNVIV